MVGPANGNNYNSGGGGGGILDWLQNHKIIAVILIAIVALVIYKRRSR